jgi:pimeloyl-ACP methyl ester carboxylesterase
MQLGVNGITLDIEIHGGAAAPPMVLIMGLGMPAAAWPPALIELLTARGLRIVCFDNRDAGHSTRLREVRAPNLGWALLRATLRLPIAAPYTLHDMAADTVGLLDALRIERAHLVGVSMGGMVAQLVAARYPQRTLTLASIMSNTGNPDPRVAFGRPHALHAILQRPLHDPADLEAVVDRLEHVYGVIGTPPRQGERAARRAHLANIARRGLDTAAARRQLLAILATGDRRPWLRQITVPTLVLHGTRDPLVPLAAGRETAACIPGARFVAIDGMGHDLPAALLPLLAEHLARHAGGRPQAPG